MSDGEERSLSPDVLEQTKEKKSFECCNCNKTYKTRSGLLRHSRTHNSRVCDVCNKEFENEHAYKRHVHKKKKTYACDICSKNCNHPADLAIHLRKHTGEKPFRCDVCNKQFGASTSLTIHQRIHTGEKPFACEECGKAFNTKSNLNCHMLMHTGERPHQCEICGRGFSQSSKLKKHLIVHTGEKPHTCKLCARSFPALSGLKSHMLTHKDETFPCPTCNKQYRSRVGLKQHSLLCGVERPYSCKLCANTYKDFTGLSYRVQPDTGTHDKKPIVSDDDNQKLNLPDNVKEEPSLTRTSLSQHVCTCRAERPHSCKICAKSYKNLAGLLYHLHTSTCIRKGKSNVSDEVDEKLNSPDNVKEPLDTTNVGSRRFACEICAKTFPFKSLLKQHYLKHTGEKPFSCNLCGKNFAFPGALYAHMRLHSDKIPYTCDICGKGFKVLQYLKLHYHRIHAGEKGATREVLSL